ncbi:hypothetical protein ACL02S_22330 [Nocardia sp. 004]|uniref:hypothetical protein n=1 Tax=Nocardia sp. 004 TaxID=3385978 RepID=UPI0039A30615
MTDPRFGTDPAYTPVTDPPSPELAAAFVRALRALPDDADPASPIAGSDAAAAD